MKQVVDLCFEDVRYFQQKYDKSVEKNSNPLIIQKYKTQLDLIKDAIIVYREYRPHE